MTGKEMIDLLALRLEDASKIDFPDSFKLEALDSAQTRVANMLANPYLTELEVLEEAFTVGDVTAGVSAVMNSTNLTGNYTLLRGGQGVLRVQDATTGTWLTRIELADVKKNENSYLAGSATNPQFFVFEKKIYTLPTTITSVNVWYLREPLPLYNQYTADGGDQTSIASSDSNITATADFYNDAVIWNITNANYYKINDFETGGIDFTVDDPGTGTAGTNLDKFYILTHDFETTNLDNVSCELSDGLHNIVLDLAEADCWGVDADLDRRSAAYEDAYAEIKALNERVQKPDGIGTEGDGRYSARTTA